MSEITLYEAQVKKLQGLCDEHNLTYRFIKDRYTVPSTLKYRISLLIGTPPFLSAGGKPGRGS